MMDPDYELFLAVVHTGNLTAAGRHLNISPAMMSKRLTRLEQRLGVHLLHRTTRRLSLTAQGEWLHADLTGIFAELARAEARVRGEPGKPSGPLRLSAPTSFGRIHLAPYLGRFLEAYPAVALSLDLSDDFLDLMSAPVDLAIRITGDVSPNLVAHRLASSERILCASPAYLERNGTPEDICTLKAHRLLAASGQLPWRLDGPEGEVLVTGESHVPTNSSDLVRELTIAGVGIGLRSLWDANEAISRGELVRVLPSYEGSRGSAIYAVHQRSPTPTEALIAMITFLSDIYHPEPPWRKL
ncbi:LysR family transcriptional regulator [Sphingomonas histidinilytica]|uniref:LysR family transcriptional regulator n=1 Tax=Rhizorhabdus histidinilytica TaxID=439228 RepID=UPI001AD9715D|nr:LysR family transcriptional regulator [Rhizorhabdus histidinilytica]MBO9379657.1 LysR family transcriptional regulator [Rhizorhabdus histidinilytica]